MMMMMMMMMITVMMINTLGNVECQQTKKEQTNNQTNKDQTSKRIGRGRCNCMQFCTSFWYSFTLFHSSAHKSSFAFWGFSWFFFFVDSRLGLNWNVKLVDKPSWRHSSRDKIFRTWEEDWRKSGRNFRCSFRLCLFLIVCLSSCLFVCIGEHLSDKTTYNMAGYTAQDAPSMCTFHLRK